MRSIAARLGISRNTVAKAVSSDGPPAYVRAPQDSGIKAVEPAIRALLPDRSSPKHPTSSCSDHPAPAKRTSPPASDIGPPSSGTGSCCHCDQLGRQAPGRPPKRQPAPGTGQAAPLRTDHRRRSRLHSVRTGRREPVLPTGLIPLRTRLPDPDFQPPVRPLGRCIRRPSRRLSHDRPHRPPRRSHHPQRLKLPPKTHPNRLAALHKTRKYGKITSVKVTHFSTRRTAHFSTIADKAQCRNILYL